MTNSYYPTNKPPQDTVLYNTERLEDTGALAAAVERNAVKREEARLYNRVRGVNENNE